MTSLRLSDSRSRLDLPTGDCKVCRQQFIKLNSLHSICSRKCLMSIPVYNGKAAKAEKRETKKKLDALKPRSHWLKEAQREFNAYIRERDAELACISCGRDHQGQWHAGHYLSTGARPELRFDGRNVHKQCQPCNTHLHGNLVLYRVGLAGRIGMGEVESLEGPHPPKHYTTDELKALAVEYRAKTKALKGKE